MVEKGKNGSQPKRVTCGGREAELSKRQRLKTVRCECPFGCVWFFLGGVGEKEEGDRWKRGKEGKKREKEEATRKKAGRPGRKEGGMTKAGLFT
jgi:hypothetical protein